MNTSKIGVPLEGFAEFSREVAAEGLVLIKNESHVLPITKEDKISIFGRSQINYYRSGTGSGGSVNVPYTVNLLEGLRQNENVSINEELAHIYEAWVKENPFDDGGGGWAAEPWHQKEMPLSKEIVEEASKVSNKAIVVIGRTAGEDQDNAVEQGSYLLTQTEKDMLRQVTTYFNQVIVVLNVSNIIDMQWLNDQDYNNAILGVIYAWQGGMEGGNATADVLTGKVVPSGKLADTIAYSIEDYPSTSNYGDENKNIYAEDIYVGYRYFETFCPEKVQFEFGYGLSYTQFEITPHEAQVMNNQEGMYLHLKVDVKNIGDTFAGKEVIQFYYEAPQGKLGKPKKVLGSFIKTKLLKPGETQEVVIMFPFSEMASYDDSGITGYKSAYVLENGDYYFYVGNSIRNVKQVSVAGKKAYTLTDLEVIEQLEEAMAPCEAFKRLKPEHKNADGTYQISYEEVPTRTIDLEKRMAKNKPKDLLITGDKGYKLRDVYDGKINIDTFISQLDQEALTTLVRGEGMSSQLATPGTASVFGGISEKLFNYGLPITATADGPSGIRMTGGLKATQVPIGTMLAATWNVPLVEALYEMEGQELKRNEIDLLLGPGMNIKRSPLNGRNFEYFSEDPLITGAFATAITKGIYKSGTHATLKHFACNNQEKRRHCVNAVVSERALREIYLKGFEKAVKQGGAKSIMTSYNPVNGNWTASHYDLTTTILRKEWGFEGIVMTDWWAQVNDVLKQGEPDTKHISFMVRAQNDLYMLVNNYGAEINAGEDDLLEALEEGSLSLGELQRSARNICKFVMDTPAFFRKQVFEDEVCCVKATKQILQGVVAELPLKENEKIELIEDQAVYIKVNESGTYRLLGSIMSEDTNLMQVSCKLCLNDEVVTIIQNRGTEGRWIKQKLNKIILEEGYYKLEYKVVEPHITVRWIELKKL